MHPEELKVLREVFESGESDRKKGITINNPYPKGSIAHEMYAGGFRAVTKGEFLEDQNEIDRCAFEYAFLNDSTVNRMTYMLASKSRIIEQLAKDKQQLVKQVADAEMKRPIHIDVSKRVAEIAYRMGYEKMYKDWSGVSHVDNSCQGVHDSAEAIDFAHYCVNEVLAPKVKPESEGDK